MIKLFKKLKPHRWRILLVLALLLGSSILDLYLPSLMSDIIDKGVAQTDTGLIFSRGVVMLLLSLLSMVLSAGVSYFSAYTATYFGKDLRYEVFAKTQSISMTQYENIGVSSLITRSTNDVAQIQMLVMMGQRMLLVAPVMAVGGIIMALKTNPGLSFVLVYALPVLVGVMAIIMSITTPLFQIVQTKVDKLNLVLRELMSGIRVIRAFNRQEKESEKFEHANTDLTNISLKVHRTMSMMFPTMMLIMNLVSLAVLYFGAGRLDVGQAEPGQIVAFIQYSMMIMNSFMMMSFAFMILPRAAASAKRIVEVLDIKEDIVDSSSPVTSFSERGLVEFENVTFKYPGAQSNVLTNISFTAKAGQTTAILGGTGSGKSTVINLIPRFYDVTEGRIKLGGVDVRDTSQKALRDKIGFVAQKAFMFSGTVTDNIRYTNTDATMDDIKHAAKIAHAADFIESELENGYDTDLSKGGLNLSGGQRQRLSIARALCRKPEVYIFDDSFSALDFKTDASLRAALKKEVSDATVIIVAQRIATVMDADNIIVLEDGEIVGQGNHSQLITSCPQYQEIAYSQLSKEEIA